ncbi:methionyl-tRNA formyltransferase [Proteinivorax tanatarense]|uniref:Methionyl-tRNA formyltransferase n=1 Tax=Proteinivorax tanatarense TaxID=1260629 RepID=A0AAU7VRT0_9FIRM
MRVVFMGTPDFAVPTLRVLNENYDLVSVVTQPDRKKGRGQKKLFSPVKTFANEHELPILQPNTVKSKDFIAKVESLSPDVIVVVAYGQIIPKQILELPPLGCINVHGSLLPAYRGAAPIHWALLKGEKTTGVTTMLMDEGMDTGDILIKRTVTISDQDNVATLHERLSKVGATTLIETLDKLKSQEIVPQPQNSKLATYAPKLTKDLCKINWSEDNIKVFNRIRGLNPWPGAYTYFRGARVKVFESEISNKDYKKTCGEVISVDHKGLLVQSKNSSIYLKVLQPENKKKMDAISFVNGYNIKEGENFEEKRRG